MTDDRRREVWTWHRRSDPGVSHVTDVEWGTDPAMPRLPLPASHTHVSQPPPGVGDGPMGDLVVVSGDPIDPDEIVVDSPEERGLKVRHAPDGRLRWEG